MTDPIRLSGVQGAVASRVAQPRPISPSADFNAALREALHKPVNLSFSAHAMQRLESRGIALDESQRQALSGALDEAAAKGARDVVLLMERTAFVANVPNRTVITAVDVREGENAVFTNVDSVVVIAPQEKESQSIPQPKPIGLDPFRGSPRAADR